MRILHAYKHYVPDMPGGIASAISVLAESSSAGVSSEVLACAAGFGGSRRYIHEGVPVTCVSSFGSLLSMPLSPAFPFMLSARMSEVDIVALHHPFPLNDLGVFLNRRDTPPIVVHWHADIMGRKVSSNLVNPFINRTLRRASRILVSDLSMIDQSQFLPAFREKCAVLPYGIEYHDWSSLTPEDHAEVERLRRQYSRLIVAFGRLVLYKGFDVLVKAMASIDATLMIIGEGPARADLEALLETHAISDKVILAGHLPRAKIKQHLHAARMFVFPSVTNAEAFGIAQLEAMAAGLPVINTSLPTAVPHVARDGLEAVTVAPGDVRQLKEAIDRLLADEEFADRLGRAGQARVRERFTVGTYADEARRIYESVVAERAGS